MGFVQTLGGPYRCFEEDGALLLTMLLACRLSLSLSLPKPRALNPKPL